MKLYAFPPSPNTWKVRAVAAHLGIPLDMEYVDLFKGASHTPAYLAINPTGRTPSLVDGDFKLGESTAIMQYVASQKPNSLWPNDARIRADVMRWQSWTLAHWSKEGCEPLLFQPVYQEFRRVLLKRFPYALYFRIAGQTVVAFMVIHGARNPKLIKTFLRKRKLYHLVINNWHAYLSQLSTTHLID